MMSRLWQGRRGVAGRHRRSGRQGGCQGGRRGHRRCGGHAPLRHRFRGGARIADHPQDRCRVAQEQAVDPAAGSARAQPDHAASHHPAADDRWRLSLLRRCGKDLRTRRAACRARARGRTGLDRPRRESFEDRKVASAIKTDFILSAEIMAITLGSVPDSGFVSQACHSGGGGRGHHRCGLWRGRAHRQGRRSRLGDGRHHIDLVDLRPCARRSAGCSSSACRIS